MTTFAYYPIYPVIVLEGNAPERKTWVQEALENPTKEIKGNWQQSIEEAAESLNPWKAPEGEPIKKVWIEGFIAGAKSQAAKEYWYEQFKQEKL